MRDTCAALALRLGVGAERVIGHKEYAAIQGKWDPGNVNMDWFRGEVAKDMRGEFKDRGRGAVVAATVCRRGRRSVRPPRAEESPVGSRSAGGRSGRCFAAGRKRLATTRREVTRRLPCAHGGRADGCGADVRAERRCTEHGVTGGQDPGEEDAGHEDVRQEEGSDEEGISDEEEGGRVSAT